MITDARKVGVLIGPENRDGINVPCRFDPYSIRHIRKVGRAVMQQVANLYTGRLVRWFESITFRQI